MSKEKLTGSLKQFSSRLPELSIAAQQATIDVLVSMAVADGQIQETELFEVESGVVGVAAFDGLGPRELPMYFGRAARRYARAALAGNLPTLMREAASHLPSSVHLNIFKMAAVVGCCDGELHHREARLLFDLGAAFEFTRDYCQALLTEVAPDVRIEQPPPEPHNELTDDPSTNKQQPAPDEVAEVAGSGAANTTDEPPVTANTRRAADSDVADNDSAANSGDDPVSLGLRDTMDSQDDAPGE